LLELEQMGQEQYLAIDVGGTKTLFSVFQPDGQLIYEHKIQTSHDYEQFKTDLALAIRRDLAAYHFSYCCCAVPGWLDFKDGIVIAFGNLPWQNVHIKSDLAELMPATKILIHNDAKLAGLSEALLIHDRYKKVLYLTISTGIGGGVIIDDVIDPNLANFEPGHMRFERDGRLQEWEHFASGKALRERYGKLAADINDEAIWRDFAKLIALGLEEILATIQPEVVVIGGGVGTHFEKFKTFLEAELVANKDPLVPIPPLFKAKRPEEAVIYGCYDYIKQNQVQFN
jgi:predicted NBD/HSP70 family sugar kinase